MAQRQIRREEKLTGKRVDREKVVERIVGKTMAQAEVELARLLPESAKTPVKKLDLPILIREKLRILKDRLANANPEMDDLEVIERALDIAIEKTDRTKGGRGRKNSDSVARPGKRPTYYSVEFDHQLWERAQAQCEYIDELSGRRCCSRFGLERDHIVPLAKGGTNELSNMRLLCRTHNLLMSRRHFRSYFANHRKTSGV